MTSATFTWSTEKTEEGFDAVVGIQHPRAEGDFSNCYEELRRVPCKTRSMAKTTAQRHMAEAAITPPKPVWVST